MKPVPSQNLTQDQANLVAAAIAALDTTYNPYSGYSVGAAVRTQTGKVFSASNVENAAYGSSICAERMAISKANSHRERHIVALAVSSRPDIPNKRHDTAAPCGSCRQVIYEMSQVSRCDIEIILSDADKTRVFLTTIEELLPFAFGPKQLQIDISKFR